MRFNPKARIDTGRVSDSGRGRGRGGGGAGGGGLNGIPIPSNIGKGGIGGVVVVILFLVLTQCLGDGGTTGGSGNQAGSGTSIDSSGTDRYDECASGEDANESADCARVIVENSLVSFWDQVLPQQSDVAFTPASVQTFTDAVGTGGCGNASADVGPFYCPADQVIYLDSTFFETVLEGQLGGKGGDFVEPYVIGHEYGHHIQNLLGTMGRVKTQEGPESDAVRLELQADCYAGMWTHGALETTDDSGVKIFDSLDKSDIDEALDSAKAVGDDLIQKKSGGRVDPEGWTHGSSAQRQAWFQQGYSATAINECDTFARGVDLDRPAG
jgi:predicted metalloprotease